MDQKSLIVRDQPGQIRASRRATIRICKRLIYQVLQPKIPCLSALARNCFPVQKLVRRKLHRGDLYHKKINYIKPAQL